MNKDYLVFSVIWLRICIVLSLLSNIFVDSHHHLTTNWVEKFSCQWLSEGASVRTHAQVTSGLLIVVYTESTYCTSWVKCCIQMEMEWFSRCFFIININWFTLTTIIVSCLALVHMHLGKRQLHLCCFCKHKIKTSDVLSFANKRFTVAKNTFDMFLRCFNKERKRRDLRLQSKLHKETKTTQKRSEGRRNAYAALPRFTSRPPSFLARALVS